MEDVQQNIPSVSKIMQNTGMENGWKKEEVNKEVKEGNRPRKYNRSLKVILTGLSPSRPKAPCRSRYSFFAPFTVYFLISYKRISRMGSVGKEAPVGFCYQPSVFCSLLLNKTALKL